MATYTGALAASGLPELAEEGEIDFPAMTLRRALHVTLRDSSGAPVKLPDPAEAPGASDDNPAHITGEVEIVGRPTVRPDLGRFPNGRMPVDTGLVFPPPAAPATIPPFPAPPDAVGIRGAALKFLESIADSIVAKIKGRTRSGWVSLAANRGGSLWTIGGSPDVERYEWHFTTSNTNKTLIAGVSGKRIVMTSCSALVDGDCTVNVACRVGFSATGSLAAVSSSGVRGVVLAHSDIPPGSGHVEGVGAGALAQGGVGESLLITSDTPTGGPLKVFATYFFEAA